jgi:hypothetical protein
LYYQIYSEGKIAWVFNMPEEVLKKLTEKLLMFESKKGIGTIIALLIM